MALLHDRVFGNPHSVNPTSTAMTELVEHARDALLAFFRASPKYVAIFTPNATGALRLVGEAYPFRPGDRFLLTFDNHNSVNGIREFARARGAETTYVPSAAPDLRVDEAILPRYLTEVAGEHHNLFAYPAQSNFSGVQHPLDWIERAHAAGWDILLDVAAFVPTNQLDFTVAPASSASPSTRCSAGHRGRRADHTTGTLAKLERPWFSGGTIVAAFVHASGTIGARRGRDNTVNFSTTGRRDRPAPPRPHRHRANHAHVRPTWSTSARARKPGTRRRITGGDGLGRPRSSGAGRRSFSFLPRTAASSTALRRACRIGTRSRCAPAAYAAWARRDRLHLSRETLVGGEFGDADARQFVQAIGLPSGGAVRTSLGIATGSHDIRRFAAFATEFAIYRVHCDLPPRTGC
jgi:hypothetical protein